LNELAAVPFDETVRTSTASLTKVQEWIVKDVLRRISQHGHAPDLTEQAALDEIVSSEHLYEQEANHLVGFDISRIKVLQRQARPSLTVDLASPEAKAYLLNYRELIERPAFELEADGFQESLPTPYWDPLLRRSRKKRVELYQALFRCSLLSFRRREKARAAFFTVRKKDNYHQRLIIDARQANAFHHRPPTTRLATPAGMVSLDFSPETLEANGFGGIAGNGDDDDDSRIPISPHAETGDVGDCFYNFLVPQLASWFSLGDWFTGAELSALGMNPGTIFDDDSQRDSPLEDSESVVACFSGMAMGWSWSLFLANESVVHQSSFPRQWDQDDIIRDKAPPPLVQPGRPAVGIYVDNIQVLAGGAGEASSRMLGIANRFSQLGIPYDIDDVHDKVEVESLGMKFDFAGRVAAMPKPRRTWRLWLATRCLLKRRRVHGKVLQVWLGHVTHHFALTRCCMSSLSACYRFAEEHKGHRAVVWPSVKKELRHCLGLFFLVEMDLSAPTSPEVHVGDSADLGYSLMTTQASHEEIRAELRFKERWRFITSSEPVRSCPLPPPQGECQSSAFVTDPLQEFHYMGSRRNAGLGRSTQFGRWLGEQVKDPQWEQWLRERHARFEAAHRPRISLIHGPGVPPVASTWDTADRWRLLVARPWDHPSEHINAKELRVCVMGLRRLCRSSSNCGTVALSLSDNLVSCLAVDKGRSSSGALNGILRRAAAYQMACRVRWQVRHIPTDRNIADGPSRWFQTKSKLKHEERSRPPLDGHVLVPDFEAGRCPSFSSTVSAERSEPSRRGFILEFFSGTARLTRAFEEKGLATLPDIEVAKGHHFNLLRRKMQKFLLQLLLEGKVLYAHFGTPCTTFSRARHNIKNVMKARQKEADAVSLAIFTARAIRILIRCGGYFTLENPLTSTLWEFQPIRDLFRSKDVFFISWHMCQYGASCKKPTGLLGNIPGLSGLAKSCGGGHRHQHLRGSERVWDEGVWKSRNRTKSAGAYPPQLCQQWASLVQDSIGHLFQLPHAVIRDQSRHVEWSLQEAAVATRHRVKTGKNGAGARHFHTENSEFTEEGKQHLKRHPVVFGQHTKSEAEEIRRANQGQKDGC